MTALPSDTPLVSIITVVYNNEDYIADALESVQSQNYDKIEHIVIDGGSTDNTLDIINLYQDKIDILVSEKDKGVYDALNKGIALSKGDIVGILHSDDLFADEFVVSDTVKKLQEDKAELAFSDLMIVSRKTRKAIRYYRSGFFKRWMLRIGWMPPHPTCFIKRSLFHEIGEYDLNFKIAGDFDFFVRAFYRRKITWTHLNRISVLMRSGGLSNMGIASKALTANEIQLALNKNGVLSFKFFQLARYAIRAIEFLSKPT